MVFQQEEPFGLSSSEKMLQKHRSRRREKSGIYNAGLLMLLNFYKMGDMRMKGKVPFYSTILMLTFLCIAHHFWLLFSTNSNVKFASQNQKILNGQSNVKLPSFKLNQQARSTRLKADAIVQNQLEVLHWNLMTANLNGIASDYISESEQQRVHVNMMLMAMEQQQAAVQQSLPGNQQRRRSPTPEPSTSTLLDFTQHHLQQQQQFYGQNLYGEDGDEPTLMDYDAIDAYWRWDIEQEKGINGGMVSQPQEHEQQNYQYPLQYDHSDQYDYIIPAPAEEQLYERDIQLLTEKSLFPELSHPTTEFFDILSVENNNHFNYNSFDGNNNDNRDHFLANNSTANNNKGWETLAQQQWPTTSTEYNEQFDEGYEFDGLFNEASLEWSPALMPKLPLTRKSITPPPAPLSTTSSRQSLQHPILFDDVSLALAGTSETLESHRNEESEAANRNPPEAILHDLDSIENLMNNAVLNDHHYQHPSLLHQEQQQQQQQLYHHPLPAHMPLSVQPIQNNNGMQEEQPTTSMSNSTVRSCPSTASSGFCSSYGTIDELSSSSICISPSSYAHHQPQQQWRCLSQSQSSSNCTYGMSSYPSSSSNFVASTNDYRSENKLVPKKPQRLLQRDNNIVNELQKPKSKRGRRSKDDSLVNMNGLPYTADQLTAMTYKEYKELMCTPELSLAQKTLIKKIRRRGRNKLAARKCRTRRLGQLPDEDEEEEEDIDMVKNEEEEEFGRDIGIQEASAAADWLEKWADGKEEIDDLDEEDEYQQYRQVEEGTTARQKNKENEEVVKDEVEEDQDQQQEEEDEWFVSDRYNDFTAVPQHQPSTSSSSSALSYRGYQQQQQQHYRQYVQQQYPQLSAPEAAFYRSRPQQQQQQQQIQRQMPSLLFASSAHQRYHQQPQQQPQPNARRAIRVHV